MNKRSFFPSFRVGSLASLAIAGLIVSTLSAAAQVTGSSQTTTDANGKQSQTVTLSATPSSTKKDDKVIQSKDTRKELQKEKKIAPVDAGLPDKVLYDKALDATKRGHFDVARLDLQTLLNTYPDSQYQMKA
jgi:outer membrane protein assembly factor BamD